jgi:HAD superfamily hydrolase (TIGR01509 family)
VAGRQPGPGEIDALLFDFGGVLIEISFDRVFARWADLAGVDVELVKSRFRHGEAYQRHERGELAHPAYFQSLRDELRIDLTDAQFADGWNQVFGPEFEQTVALLPLLRARVPLYLFSNTNPFHFDYWRDRYAKALQPFRRMFISCEMGVRKPHREAFERVAKEIGVPAGRILFFDDTEPNIEGAREAGMHAVHVRSPEDVRRAVAPWLDPEARR